MDTDGSTQSVNILAHFMLLSHIRGCLIPGMLPFEESDLSPGTGRISRIRLGLKATVFLPERNRRGTRWEVFIIVWNNFERSGLSGPPGDAAGYSRLWAAGGRKGSQVVRSGGLQGKEMDMRCECYRMVAELVETDRSLVRRGVLAGRLLIKCRKCRRQYVVDGLTLADGAHIESGAKAQR